MLGTLGAWSDPRAIIGVGGKVLDDPELMRAEYFDDEAFWLLSAEEWGIAKSSRPQVTSDACTILNESGHVIVRNGRTSSSDYCFIRAGAFGMGGAGFSHHSHNDLFSPILYLNGCLILTDTGTSVYLGNDPERDYLRSASAHNATFSASWNFFEPRRWFGWKRVLDGAILHAVQTPEETRIECGYAPPGRVPFKRSFIYSTPVRTFRVEELFMGDVADVHSYFHLDSGLTVRPEKNHLDVVKGDRSIAEISYPDGIEMKIEEGWISKSYGSKERSKILHFRRNAAAGRAEQFLFAAL